MLISTAAIVLSLADPVHPISGVQSPRRSSSAMLPVPELARKPSLSRGVASDPWRVGGLPRAASLTGHAQGQ